MPWKTDGPMSPELKARLKLVRGRLETASFECPYTGAIKGGRSIKLTHGILAEKDGNTGRCLATERYARGLIQRASKAVKDIPGVEVKLSSTISQMRDTPPTRQYQVTVRVLELETANV